VREKVTVLDTAPRIAEAMCRMHCVGSLVALLKSQQQHHYRARASC
jgi:hypothetical protein